MATRLISASGIGFRLFGFDVTINWFHFMLPALWLSGIDFTRLAPGVSAVGVILAYTGAVVLGVLAHELGHAFAARSIGASAEIELILFGGLTSWSKGGEITPRERLRVSLAGPLVGMAVGAVSWWLASTALGDVRLEVAIFLDLLTQVALVWGVLNLIPFPGFDGGHSLDAALEIAVPDRAARWGAAVKGAASLLGVLGAWYYFGLLSAAFLAFFIFRGGGPLREYRRSLDGDRSTRLDQARLMTRQGRLSGALHTVDSLLEGARSKEIVSDAEALRTALLLWTERWEDLAVEDTDDLRVRGLALLRTGRAQDAEVVLRHGDPGDWRDALLVEALVRQGVTVVDDPDLGGARPAALVAHARTLVADAPAIAGQIADVALRHDSLPPSDRVVAAMVAGRMDEAATAAESMAPAVGWVVESVDRSRRGIGIDPLLAAQQDRSAVESVQVLLHQFGRYEESIVAGRRALALGSEPKVAGFNLACSAARLGDVDTALEHLDAALRDGLEPQRALSDTDLAGLHDTDGFASALSGAR